MYEIILQRRSLCESQAQLQLELSPRSECNMYQYKKKADREQRQFILIVAGPSVRCQKCGDCIVQGAKGSKASQQTSDCTRVEGHCVSLKYSGVSPRHLEEVLRLGRF